MRHRKIKKIPGRGANHRRALTKNLLASFFLHGKILTTEAKAKAIKPKVESLITVGKRNTLAARRKIISATGSNDIATKILAEIAPRYKERQGGYTKILKYKNRSGDGAPSVYLTLV